MCLPLDHHPAKHYGNEFEQSTVIPGSEGFTIPFAFALYYVGFVVLSTEP